jgi:mono/diheme cytochrome c family protein
VPDLANGKTMFLIGGCSSCHATPGQDDKAKLGGGLGLKSPFGTFYAPNISPNQNDGIGRWSEVDFVTAMLKGTSPDGQHLYPAFPYTSYQRMRTEDVRDLFAYLKTLPAVAGGSKPHDLPFPFSIRRTLGIWKLLFLDGEPFKPEPGKDAAWNRGAYLVNGPGHCAECHSPRNLLGGIVAGQRFAGGPDPSGGDGFVPNITQKSLTLSRDELVTLLETGEMPDGDIIGGEMGKVTVNTGQLSAQDRAAIATYVMSLPPVEGPKPPESR